MTGQFLSGDAAIKVGTKKMTGFVDKIVTSLWANQTQLITWYYQTLYQKFKNLKTKNIRWLTKFYLEFIIMFFKKHTHTQI